MTVCPGLTGSFADSKNMPPFTIGVVFGCERHATDVFSALLLQYTITRPPVIPKHIDDWCIAQRSRTIVSMLRLNDA